MAQKKKAKKAKTMGKKDLKKTKGGLNFASPTLTTAKLDSTNLTLDTSLNTSSLNYFK